LDEQATQINIRNEIESLVKYVDHRSQLALRCTHNVVGLQHLETHL